MTARWDRLRDVYSLGVILYEMLTGHVPFKGTGAETLKLIEQGAKRPSSLRPEVPAVLDDVCLKMIAADPGDRFESMRHVYQTLTRFLEDPGVDEPVAESSGEHACLPRVEQLESQKSHIGNLRREGEFEAALRLLNQMAGLQDPRYAGYAAWAREQIPIVRAEPAKIRKQRAAALDTAVQLIDEYDYQGAVDLLQQIPRALRTAPIHSVLERALTLNSRCERLAQQISEGFQRKDTRKLLKKVEQLIDLKPNDSKAHQWYFRLTGKRLREDGSKPIHAGAYIVWPVVGVALLAFAVLIALGIKEYGPSFDAPDVDSPDIKLADSENEKSDDERVDPMPPEGDPPRNDDPDAKQPVVNQDDWRTIDLLKVIDPTKHAVKGVWKIDASALVTESGDERVLQIPVSPPAEYELRVTATRTSAKAAKPGLLFGLVGGGQHFLSILGQKGDENGLHQLDDKLLLRENASFLRKAVITDGEAVSITYKVTTDSVSVLVDGTVITNWQGNFGRLKPGKDHTPPNIKQLAIKTYTDFRFSKIELSVPETANVVFDADVNKPQKGDGKTDGKTGGGQAGNGVPGMVCKKLEVNQAVAGLTRDAVAFDGPRGDGRDGARGVYLIRKSALTEGSAWAFKYDRTHPSRGAQIIHPFRNGHLMVLLAPHTVGMTSNGIWRGYMRGGGHLYQKTANFAGAFPIGPQNPNVDVLSVLEPDGSYSLSFNGKVILRTKVANPAPLQLSKGFEGRGIPLRWPPAATGLIIGPTDKARNVATDVYLTSAKDRGKPPAAKKPAAP